MNNTANEMGQGNAPVVRHSEIAVRHLENAIAQLASLTAQIESARMEVAAAQAILFTYPRHMRDSKASEEIGRDASRLLTAKMKIIDSIAHLEKYVSRAPKATHSIRK